MSPADRPGRTGILASGIVVVAAVVLFVAVLGRIQPWFAGAAAPTAVATPSGASTSPQPTEPPTPRPTAVLPRSWTLARLDAPLGHGSFVVRGVSSDGGVVVFQDPSVYDRLYVEHDGPVDEILVPSHAVGTPMAARLSPNADHVLVLESNHLWSYDIASRATVAVPDPPGGPGVVTFEFVSETSVAVLSDASTTPEPPRSQLWRLDLETGAWTKIGDRHDGIYLFSTARGIVPVVDESARHDDSGWHLYLVGADGGDRLLYDASGWGHVAVSADGLHLGLSKGGPGGSTSIVDLTSGTITPAGHDGIVQTFSPDGRLLEVLGEATNSVVVYRLDGTPASTLLDPTELGWVEMVAPAPSGGIP